MSADTEPESPWNECEVCGATMPAAAMAVGLRVCGAKCRKEQTDFYDEVKIRGWDAMPLPEQEEPRE